MFTFYADADFLEHFLYLGKNLPKRLCFLHGKSQKAKAILFEKFKINFVDSTSHGMLFLRPFLENQVAGCCNLDTGNWLLDGDFFPLPKNLPMPASSILHLHTEGKDFPNRHPLLRYLHKRTEQKMTLSKGYAAAAASMVQAKEDLLYPALQKGKIVQEVLRFTQQNVGISRALCKKPIHDCGAISTLTPWGVQTLPIATILKPSSAFLIRDKLQAIAPLLISGLSASFAAYGYDVYTFTSAFKKEPLHLFIPELNMGFFTQTLQEKFSFSMAGSFSTLRFLPLHALLDCIPKLRFYALMQEELLNSAVFALLEAEEYRSSYESILESKLDIAFLKEQNQKLFSFFKIF